MRFKKVFALSFLLYFFSSACIYAEAINKNDNKFLIPMGNVIQIDAELESLMVRGCSNKDSLKVGDSLVSVNGTNIKNYAEFSSLLHSIPNNSLVPLEVKRNN